MPRGNQREVTILSTGMPILYSLSTTYRRIKLPMYLIVEKMNLTKQMEESLEIGLEIGRELAQRSQKKYHYKFTPKSREQFGLISTLFQKFSKDMFRKFKKLLIPEDELNSDVVFSIEDLEKQKDSLNETMAKIFQDSSKTTSRSFPELLPSLPQFPIIDTQLYRDILKK